MTRPYTYGSPYLPDSCPEAGAPWNQPDDERVPITCGGCQRTFEPGDDKTEAKYDETAREGVCCLECSVVEQLRDIHQRFSMSAGDRDALKIAVNTLLWSREQDIDFATTPLMPDQGGIK